MLNKINFELANINSDSQLRKYPRNSQVLPDVESSVIHNSSQLDIKISDTEEHYRKSATSLQPKKGNYLADANQSYRSIHELLKRKQFSPNRSSYLDRIQLPHLIISTKSDRNLGPGTYQILSKTPGPHCEFSTSPRFQFENNYSFYKRANITKELKKAISERIKKNKDLTRFEPINKIELLVEKTKKKLIIEKINKKAKEYLCTDKKSKLENQYVTKFRKREIRKSKETLREISKS